MAYQPGALQVAEHPSSHLPDLQRQRRVDHRGWNGERVLRRASDHPGQRACGDGSAGQRGVAQWRGCGLLPLWRGEGDDSGLGKNVKQSQIHPTGLEKFRVTRA